MDHLVQQGEEIAFRLGYDDINESLTHRDVVCRTLIALGTTKQALRSGAPNGAYDGITQLGCSATATASDDGDLHGATCHRESFDVQKAAVFWSQKVFTKTYYERRRWA